MSRRRDEDPKRRAIGQGTADLSNLGMKTPRVHSCHQLNPPILSEPFTFPEYLQIVSAIPELTTSPTTHLQPS
jgi:hypothetical protein